MHRTTRTTHTFPKKNILFWRRIDAVIHSNKYKRLYRRVLAIRFPNIYTRFFFLFYFIPFEIACRRVLRICAGTWKMSFHPVLYKLTYILLYVKPSITAAAPQLQECPQFWFHDDDISSECVCIKISLYNHAQWFDSVYVCESLWW